MQCTVFSPPSYLFLFLFSHSLHLSPSFSLALSQSLPLLCSHGRLDNIMHRPLTVSAWDSSCVWHRCKSLASTLQYYIICDSQINTVDMASSPQDCTTWKHLFKAICPMLQNMCFKTLYFMHIAAHLQMEFSENNQQIMLLGDQPKVRLCRGQGHLCLRASFQLRITKEK